MIRFVKLLVTLFSAFVTLFFLTTLFSIFTEQPDWICAAYSLPGAAVVGWMVWKSASGKSIGPGFTMLAGALLLGGLGFAIGFLGPMLFAPSANQGPMLGIFITGPLGLVAGAIGGLVYALRKRAEASDRDSI